MYFLIILCVAFSPQIIKASNEINWNNWNSTILSPSELQFSEVQILKWTNSAMRFLLDFPLCLDSNLGSEDECFKLSTTLNSQVAVYLGYDKKRASSSRHHQIIGNTHVYKTRENAHSGSSASRSFVLVKGNNEIYSPGQSGHQQQNLQLQNLLHGRRKVFAVLPDASSVKASGPHDLILALDPYPQANFGHLIGLFYVDFNVEGKYCKDGHQVYINDQTCITVARKPRCPNMLERQATGYHPRRCHIDFLPTVHLSLGSSEIYNIQSSNLLDCISLPGFANCPRLRSIEDTQNVLCDATHTNSKRCDTSYTGIGTRCKLFQTCDRAVLIGGGWNRLHSNSQSLQNILNMEEMLTRIGFLEENIKLFYANGKLASTPDSKPRYFSSAMKTGIRGHIRTICETRHCADTFFIYLNNPTNIEGDFLLWDMDKNGIADDLEVYTAKEFLSDISNCEAKRITIVAEQSNSNTLSSLLKQSSEHQNVFLVTSGSANQIVTNGDLTNAFVNSTLPTTCLSSIQQGYGLRMRDSVPNVYDTSGGTIPQLSIIGAPCDLNPPLQERELKSLYQGCQNIPTSIWFSLNYGEFHEDDDELDEKESNENSPSNRRTQ